MATSSRTHIGWIDLAKGISILLVVFHHGIQSVYGMPGLELAGITATAANVYELLSQKLVPIRMPLFFMISGFLVHRAATRYQWKDVWFKRVQTIWYVYVLWSLIQWAAVSYIMWSVGAEKPASETMISNYANDLGTFAGLTLIGTSSLWYLYALPVYFILCKAMSSRPGFAIGFFLACHFLSSYYNLQFPTSSIVKNGIFYAIGVFFSPVLFPMINNISHKAFLYIGGILAVKVGLGFIGVDVALLNTLMFVTIMVFFINWFQEHFDIPVLRWIGKNTLSIYIIHHILLKLLVFILVPMMISAGWFNNATFATAWALFAPVVALVFMTAGSLFIWKYTHSGVGKYLYESPRRAVVGPKPA